MFGSSELFFYNEGMCFKTKEGNRLITSRIYRYMSCTRYNNFFVKKEPCTLIIDLVNNGGDINFILIDKTNSEEKKLTNPESGTYEFELLPGHKYTLKTLAKKTHGRYRISIRK